jgi:hypothetical protein
MADLTPNDNPKQSAAGGGGGSAPESEAGADAGGSTANNGHFPVAAGSRRPVSRWQRHMGTTRRWMRDTFNRDQLVAGLKQLMWVAPLTLLVWIYAERAQQVDETIRVTIEAHSSDPKTAVRLLDPPDGSVLMTIKGPRSRVDELHRTIESRPTPVRFEVPPGLPTGTQHLLEVKQSVANDSRFAGVAVTGSQPPRVNVAVDRLEEQVRPVQLRPEDRAKFEQAVFTPSEVKVRVPAKTLEGPLKNNITVYADLSNFPDMTPGPKSDIRGIPLKVDKAEGLPDVTVEPSTATVSLTVRPRNKDTVLSSLFIREEDDSPLLRNAARVTFDPNMYQVKLAGPPDAIATIEKNPDSVRAVITLTSEELRQGGSFQKEIRFVDLPPGVKFVSSGAIAEGQPAKVDVKIEIGKGSGAE